MTFNQSITYFPIHLHYLPIYISHGMIRASRLIVIRAARKHVVSHWRLSLLTTQHPFYFTLHYSILFYSTACPALLHYPSFLLLPLRLTFASLPSLSSRLPRSVFACYSDSVKKYHLTHIQ